MFYLFKDALNTFNLLCVGNMERETRYCHFMGHSFHLAARGLLYAPFHREDSTSLSLCYISYWALAGMGNSSMGSQWWNDMKAHCIMSGYSRLIFKAHKVSLMNALHIKIHALPRSFQYTDTLLIQINGGFLQYI